MDTLRSMGHDTAKLWEAIGQLVTKTLVSVQPHLEHTYYTCRQRSDDAGFRNSLGSQAAGGQRSVAAGQRP